MKGIPASSIAFLTSIFSSNVTLPGSMASPILAGSIPNSDGRNRCTARFNFLESTSAIYIPRRRQEASKASYLDVPGLFDGLDELELEEDVVAAEVDARHSADDDIDLPHCIDEAPVVGEGALDEARPLGLEGKEHLELVDVEADLRAEEDVGGIAILEAGLHDAPAQVTSAAHHEHAALALHILPRASSSVVPQSDLPGALSLQQLGLLRRQRWRFLSRVLRASVWKRASCRPLPSAWHDSEDGFSPPVLIEDSGFTIEKWNLHVQ